MLKKECNIGITTGCGEFRSDEALSIAKKMNHGCNIAFQCKKYCFIAPKQSDFDSIEKNCKYIWDVIKNNENNDIMLQIDTQKFSKDVKMYILNAHESDSDGSDSA